MAFPLFSVNQIPLGAFAIPDGALFAVGMENSVIAPIGVMRPIASGPLLPVWVNQRSPSASLNVM